MYASKIQEYHIIISLPKHHHVMNGGCAEKILSPNLRSPDPCKKGPHQKQSHIMKSRGIKVEKDSSHGGPPGLPKGVISNSKIVTYDFPLQVLPHFNPTQEEFPHQESPFFTIAGSFWEKKRIQGQKQDHLQPEEERVRPNDPEAVEFGERSAQESEVVVNNARISSPLNRNITPTWIEQNFVTPESNLNSDSLWLQMSQYAEKTYKQFAELEASH
ncbi:hypothetical protein O181_032819 [Austropuccinia psidii MF-1]|uniref:Uncharacterized protein n=1 Tax=Austropuccinia psidii MF-1 TaxID=1389203 RepID=A0A9Q3H7X4_9BASI|nr:hypothetical protein [Austropuccinia psidii MF-1]